MTSRPAPYSGEILHFDDGIAWLRDAWKILTARLGHWILFGVVTILLTSLVSFVPVLGGLVGIFLTPIFGASYVLTATLQENGRKTGVENVFLGFQHRLDQLVLIGVIQLGLTLGGLLSAIVLSGILVGLAGLLSPVFSFSNLQLLLSDSAQGVLPGPSEQAILILIVTLVSAIFLGAAVVVSMMTWFAPALVSLQDMDAWPAMKASLSACVKQVPAITGYGLGVLGVAAAVLLTLGLGTLIAIPWIQVSSYTGYKALFSSRPAALES